MSFSNIEAHNRATEMVRIALQSGVIKLNGSSSSNSVAAAEAEAKVDAKYLNTLIAELSAFVQQVK